MSRPWIDVVYGTRPEAVKCARRWSRNSRRRSSARTTVTVTGQHRQMADEVNASFGIAPPTSTSMSFGAGIARRDVVRDLRAALAHRWAEAAPDAVVVQGDTASAALAAVAAYYAGSRVIHLEPDCDRAICARPSPRKATAG